MKFNSIKFEIAVIYNFILGMILILFSAVLYLIFSTLYEEINHELQVKALAVNRTIHAYLDVLGETPTALSTAAEKTVSLQSENPFKIKSKKVSQNWLKRSNELELDKDFMNFINSSGASIAKSKNLPDDLVGLFLKNGVLSKDGGRSFQKITYHGQNIRVINEPFRYKEGEEYIIQIGVIEEPITEFMQNWLYSIAISIPLILILTSFVGQLFAKRILEPVEEITKMAQNITYQDLSLRVKSKHFDDEMKNLVEAFNDMISRLERSFRHIEQFSVHAAHELKTPLTIIKGELELSLRRERDSSEYQRAIKISLEESERMIKTVEDLLLLAKLDYQPQVFDFEPIEFDSFIRKIYEQSKILAVPKNITVSLEAPRKSLLIQADPLHLRRLFFNIIENAVKFTPRGGRIDLDVKVEEKKVLTSIADSGVGISPEHLSKIFERFYRTTKQEDGTGLGLSIAQRIAKIHQGEIMVNSKVNQGTTFIVVLPAT